jgi:hypothetical protein
MSSLKSPDGTLIPFVRFFAIPAAGPWDQDRAAKLNASLGSPIPADDAAICIRRLGLWSPNEPARYAAAYMRKSQISGEHRLTKALEGRDVEFVFRDDRLVRTQRMRRLTDLVLVVVAGVAVLLAATKSLTARSDNALVAAGAKRALQMSLARQTELTREEKISALLARAGGQTRGGDDLMRDLAWVARSKRADSQIEALTWEAGALTLKTADQSNPIASTDRQVSAISSPDGVSWRVAPAPQTSALTSLNRLPSIISRPPPAVARHSDR